MPSGLLTITFQYMYICVRQFELVATVTFISKKFYFNKHCVIDKKMCCTLQQNRCCCCPLRTGTIIMSVFLCISTAAFLFCFLPVTHSLFTSNYEEYAKDVKQFEYLWAQIETLSFIPRICYCIIHLLVFILLIIGVQQRNNKFFIPWLTFMGINCVLATFGTFSLIGVMIFLLVHYVAKTLVVIIFFIATLISTLWWYFFLCVWSYYTELKEEKMFKEPIVASFSRESAV